MRPVRAWHQPTVAVRACLSNLPTLWESASERGANILTAFEDFDLKDKAVICDCLVLASWFDSGAKMAI